MSQHAPPRLQRCPSCGADVPVESGWVPWCDGCDWNVDPQSSQARPGRLARWWAPRLDRAARHEHEHLMATVDREPPEHSLYRVVQALAVLVHLTTVLVLVGGAAAVALLPFQIAVVVGPLLFLTALAVAPLPRLRRGARPTTWTREDAPACFALLDLLASRVAAPTPERLVVDADFNASVSRQRRRRTLTIGLPLWHVLDDGQRVALLGHELGHETNGDVRRKGVVAAAIDTLEHWYYLLTPSELMHWRRDIGTGMTGHGMSFVWLEAIAAAAVAVPMAFIRGFGAVLDRAVQPCAQRAEYRADRSSVAAAGRSAAVSLLDVLLVLPAVDFAVLTAVRAGRTDLLAAATERLASIPPREAARRRRVADVELLRYDESHPPTTLRLRYVAAVPEPSYDTAVDAALLAAADAELRRATPVVEHTLREAVDC